MILNGSNITATGLAGGGRTANAANVAKIKHKVQLFQDGSGPRRFDVQKVIIHPGEINSLRVWQKNRRLIATHSDSRKVYLWDIVAQKTVKDKIKMPANIPDLVLEGHEAVADYALAWSPVAPIIASGGKDRKILLWNIESFLQ